MPSPFFIIGTGRCGSTRLYELLAGHPKIALTNEGRIVDLFFHASRLAALPTYQPADFLIHEPVRLHGVVNPGCVEVVSRVFDRFIRDALPTIYRELFPDRDFAWWGDKLPDPHAARAAQELFPDTRYVILVRDPRDVLCSFRSFALKPRVRENRFMQPLPVPDFCVYWRSLYDSAVQFLHPHLLVRYEDLVEDPPKIIAAILAHLDLEPVAGIDYGIDEGSFAQHGTSRSTRDSVGRWRRELQPDEAAMMADKLGDMLAKYGYALT